MAGPNAINGTKLTPERESELLDLLAQGHNLTMAAAKLGIHRQTAYKHAQDDPDFKLAIQEAREAGVDLVEDWMLDKARAPNGFLANIVWLKAHRPQKWREDRQVGPAPTINIVIQAPSAQEIRDIIDADYRLLSQGSAVQEGQDDADST